MANVSLKQIRKSFGAVEIIKGVDLDIAHGEFVVFVGPSGCGKSTLLRLIAGLEEITGGSLSIGDKVVNNLPPKDRSVAMVFQSYALFPHMTVRDNVAFGLKIAGAPKAELEAKVAEAARMLKLEPLLDRKPAQLSGGQRQRVAIGRSIVRNPKVFLFDEPLSNLDAALRGDMRVELSQLHRALAATMIYVTHDQIEAMTMAHRIVVLNAGKVEQFGTPMELYHHPATRFVATFIGQPNMNLIPATVLGKDASGLAVELDGGVRLTLPVEPDTAKKGDRVEVGMRPENVALGTALSMTVRVLERLGGTSITYGTLPNGQRFCAALPGDAAVAEGQTITLSVNPADCHVFDAKGQVMRRRMAPALAA